MDPAKATEDTTVVEVITLLPDAAKDLEANNDDKGYGHTAPPSEKKDKMVPFDDLPVKPEVAKAALKAGEASTPVQEAPPPSSGEKLCGTIIRAGKLVTTIIVFPFMVVIMIMCATIGGVCNLWHRMWNRKVPAVTIQPGENPIDEFDLDSPDLDWSHLKKNYVSRSIPFILYASSGREIAPMKPWPQGPLDGKMRICLDKQWRSFPGLDDIVRTLYGWFFSYRTMPPLWLQGNYMAGVAHIDCMPSAHNIYYLVKGQKDIIIAPPAVSRAMKLTAGTDNWHIPSSKGGNIDYVPSVPSYWRVRMQQNRVLVFNATACLHHFLNLGAMVDGQLPFTQALSLHVPHCRDTDPRVLACLAFFPQLWWSNSKLFLNIVGVMFGMTLSESRYQEET